MLGQTEEAVGHYQALVRLNPGDNQGVRFILVPRLIQLGHDTAAMKLLEEYSGDIMATSLYSQVLLAFRAEGDSPAARAAFCKARQANPHVAKYILAENELPPSLPSSYSLGSEEEALVCVTELQEAWDSTPGAAEWLELQERQTAKRRNKRQNAKHRKRRRQRH